MSDLSQAIGAALLGDGAGQVTGIGHDSREVGEGELFVSLHGEHTDGAAHLDEALTRGAVAACVSRAAAAALHIRGIPLLVVEEPRAALADLSAVFYGHPARALRLIGITGTLGKTSTAAFVQAALARSSPGPGVAMIGSLGVGIAGPADGGASRVMGLDGMTTPDAPALHRALRLLVEAGVHTAVIEVTSHALAHERVRGLGFSVGVLTNLVPDEHLEFHGTAEEYIEVKARFLDYLLPGAPLVYNADDALVRALLDIRVMHTGRPLVGVGFETASGSGDRAVLVEGVRWHDHGSDFTLSVRVPVPGPGGELIAPSRVAVSLPLLGVQHVSNAAVAATAALLAGATVDDVVSSLAHVAPVRRRMEVVRAGAPRIVDDTTGNPESLRAVLQTVQAIPRSGLRIVFGLRGSRGVEINTLLAEALADLVLERAREEPVRLIVTWCEDLAAERDRVKPDEREAALLVLSTRLGPASPALHYGTEPTLAGAIRSVLSRVGDDELVLLLGTQGMDQAARLAATVLGEHSARAM